MPIKILESSVISKIAAGEVVERPASVVKELLENSLDANSKNITVEIQGSGLNLIRISDDGDGIPSGEVELAFVRHATSKLSVAHDLDSIKTLGFRGEALASIAAVSIVRISSRYKHENEGTSLHLVAGNLRNRRIIGIPVGTVIEIEDLFHNARPRLKFLKSASTEKGLIKRLVTKYAMAYADVRFSFISEGRMRFQTDGKGKVLDVVNSIYGVDVGSKMLEIGPYERDDVTVNGLISKPDLSRSNRQDITLIINGRNVVDSQLNVAIMRAYHTMLMRKKFPIAFISISVTNSEVDVNVHPTKSEVRFVEKTKIFRSIEGAVRQTLLGNVSSTGLLQFDNAVKPQDKYFHKLNLSDKETVNKSNNLSEQYIEKMVDMGMPVLRSIGQVSNAYLIAEGPDGLHVIDQHAAHERILYEKYVSEYKVGRVQSQMLLESEIIHTISEDTETLRGILDKLHNLGFDIEYFGNDRFIIRAVPHLIDKLDFKQVISSILDKGADDVYGIPEWTEDKLIKKVCRLIAVRAGKTLSCDEQMALLRDLEKCENPSTCPHGRPTIIHYSFASMRNKFGRTGS